MKRLTVRCRRCGYIGPIPAAGLCDGHHAEHACTATVCPNCGVSHAWEPFGVPRPAQLTQDEWQTSQAILRQVFGGRE